MDVKFKLLLIGFLIFSLSCFGEEYSVKREILFNSDIAEDATPHILKKIGELDSRSEVELRFEKGEYHFYPDKGSEKYSYISNHCDLMVVSAFPIENFKGVTIDGQGSTFIFHGIIIPFLIENSSDVTVKNLSIDWDQTFHSECKVINNNEVDRTFDIEVKGAYDIRDGQLNFIKPYYEYNLGQTILYDPERRAILFDTESYTNLTASKKAEVSRGVDQIKYKYDVDPRALIYKKIGKESKLICKEIKPGVVRIFNHTKKIPPVGSILTAKGEQGLNRVAPAFRLSNVDTFNGNSVDIHHAGGMGIIAENSADITLDNFNITPSKDRMVSTTADATHFVGCRGKIVLKNSTFENQLDDGLNVHGAYQKVVDILGSNRIGVRMGHDQQKGFTIGVEGDTLGFVRLSRSFFAYEQAVISSVEFVNGRYQIITLDRKVPESVKCGDLIENITAYPELLVQNCKIQNNRARGLLLSTPKKIVIRDNFFSTEMDAILIPVESGHWFESGNASDLTIDNNIFQDCVHSGQNRGVIRFATDDDNENIAFRNITISNNIFNHFDNWILEATNVDGLKFINNTITNSGSFPMLFPNNPAVTVKYSKNVLFKSNRYEGEATEMIKSDKNIEFN